MSTASMINPLSTAKRSGVKREYSASDVQEPKIKEGYGSTVGKQRDSKDELRDSRPLLSFEKMRRDEGNLRVTADEG